MSTPLEPASIIIPAYNEENAIEEVVAELKQVMDASGHPYEIIIVDDGSRDKTTEKAQNTGARVLRHLKNRGYGASLKTGIRAARYENIVITDADGTYPGTRIPDILRELQNADMVIGARTGQNVNIPLIRRFPKWILRRLASHVTGERIPDLNSGLRAFRRTCIMQYLTILSDRFSFTTTSTVAMLSDHYHVIFMPIDYMKRVGKSKIVPWDFINFLTIVLRLSMLFNPLRVFVPVAAVFLTAGFAKFGLDIWFAMERIGGLSWEILKQPTVSTTTLILTLAGLQIFLIGMISDGLVRKITQRIPAPYQTREIVAAEEPSNLDEHSVVEETQNGNLSEQKG